MSVVDDVGGDFERRLGVRADRGSAAGHRQDHADLDHLVLGIRAGAKRKRHRGRAKQPGDMLQIHEI
jgi:hypothetical protein